MGVYASGFAPSLLPPTFPDGDCNGVAEPSTFTLTENAAAGTIVGSVTATDPGNDPLAPSETVTVMLTSGDTAAWPVSYPLRLSGAAGGLRRGRPSCACSRSRGSRWSRTARLESRCAGRRSPAVFIEAPAGGRAVDPDSAAVVLAGVDGNELALGRCGLTRSITAPARDGGVGTQAARVVLEAHADGDELTLRRCGLIEEVVAPAGEGAVGPHSTGVVVAGAGGRECTVGRRRLSVIIAPPARDGAVGPHAARVILPRRRRDYSTYCPLSGS